MARRSTTLCLLDTCDKDGTPTYKGPYKDTTGSLSSIETPDATTIVFHLTQRLRRLRLPDGAAASAPVPQARDTGNKYTEHPAVDRPVHVRQVRRGQVDLLQAQPELVAGDGQDPQAARSTGRAARSSPTLTRPTRRCRPATIDLEPDGGVQASFRAQIDGNPTLKAQADNPVTGFTRYLVVIQTVAPLTNVHCRRAIFYAINKAALRTARGGTLRRRHRQPMTPPAIPGYDARRQPVPGRCGQHR